MGTSCLQYNSSYLATGHSPHRGYFPEWRHSRSEAEKRLNRVPGEPEVIIGDQEREDDAAYGTDGPSDTHGARSLKTKVDVGDTQTEKNSVGSVDELDGGAVEFGQCDEELCDDVSGSNAGQKQWRRMREWVKRHT
jgi:hypothetical protein